MTHTVLADLPDEWTLARAADDDEARGIYLWDLLAVNPDGEAFPLRWIERYGEIERVEILRDGEWREFPEATRREVALEER